ncbi:hypothetical protein GV819_07815 [Pseudomonas sp. Fl5BN2]|uniref:DUF7677 family protein n=1 Tax=unclassified Pseudomonas TaxID=196821 RepID=UPI00137865A4|nr:MULTISPECIES: hypothetical protein [unclassified Pseudomonas]NBF02197.1 hypothetical protein [Pseudomonas sp. Fl5BN2]NBF07864.1 hypothetical protein [Pseudomonas sp. Fl4BN1]
MLYPKKLSSEFSGALRTFSFWVANGTLGYPLLEGVDYRACLGQEPSMLEMAYAIFANVLELDEQGVPVNAKYAEHRAAQYIRQYCDPGYSAVPGFEAWEQALHEPPDRDDSKPWPLAVV